MSSKVNDSNSTHSYGTISPSNIQWISWLAAILVAGISVMIFLYSNFQTKLDASADRYDLEKRLERIEDKIDLLVLRYK